MCLLPLGWIGPYALAQRLLSVEPILPDGSVFATNTTRHTYSEVFFLNGCMCLTLWLLCSHISLPSGFVSAHDAIATMLDAMLDAVCSTGSTVYLNEGENAKL